MKITSQLSSILLVLLIVSTWPLIWIKTTLIKRAEIKIPIFNQIPRFKLLLKFDPVFNLKKLNQDLKSVSHSFVLKSTSSSSFDLLRNGEYHFHFYCKLASQSSHYAVDIGPFRHITIKVRSECTQEIFNDITFPIISGIFANEFHLVPKNALYENLKTIKYSRNYQTTFNLLIADPATNKTTWDIKPALQKYISPFIKQYSSISNITVSTQILLYSTLSDSLKPEYSKRYNSNTLSSTQLSNFINGAEWNLANPVSSATPITFIHYIPSTPINIIKSNGELLPSNAFLIPRWGGVIIENNNPINIKKSMMIYISQLRQILGISKTWSAPSNLVYLFNYSHSILLLITRMEMLV